MAIDFNKTFGAPKASNGATSASDKPKAQFWLNIGYESDVTDDSGKAMFVSLPSGIPLDTQDHVVAKGRNTDFVNFQSSRNDLLDQMLAHAANLKPGEDCILNLQIQLRRVNEDAAPVDPTTNPFTKQLSL